LTEIKLKKGEPIEKALRRLKKKIDREGTLRTVRSHRHYEKPSERRRRKEKAAAFTAWANYRLRVESIWISFYITISLPRILSIYEKVRLI